MTDLKTRIHDDLGQAMKDQDKVKVSTLRLTASAISNAETAGKSRIDLDEDAIVRVLRSELKRRVDAAEAYTAAGHTDRATLELKEAEVIQAYLPAEMSDDELNKLVTEAVTRLATEGVVGNKAKGAAIKAVREAAGNRCAGDRIARAVMAALD